MECYFLTFRVERRAPREDAAMVYNGLFVPGSLSENVDPEVEDVGHRRGVVAPRSSSGLSVFQSDEPGDLGQALAFRLPSRRTPLGDFPGKFNRDCAA
jgi:hypothetical protein